MPLLFPQNSVHASAGCCDGAEETRAAALVLSLKLYFEALMPLFYTFNILILKPLMPFQNPVHAPPRCRNSPQGTRAAAQGRADPCLYFIPLFHTFSLYFIPLIPLFSVCRTQCMRLLVAVMVLKEPELFFI